MPLLHIASKQETAKGQSYGKFEENPQYGVVSLIKHTLVTTAW